MPQRLLFVHGTGVRAESYAATMSTLQRQITRHDLPLEVHGCFWGEAEGARLNAGGASIPGYGDSGGRLPTAADELLALWAVLYSDPWYELRLLRHRPAMAVPPGREAPSRTLRRTVDEYVPSDKTRQEFSDAQLDAFLGEALAQMRRAPELDEAIATAPADPLEHRQAIARAAVAATLVAAQRAGWPPVAGTIRDQLVHCIQADIRGGGMGIGSHLLRPVKGFASHWVTRRLKGDRGALSDAAAPLTGDVLRFLAHSQGVRTYVQRAIQDLGRGPTFLLAHSLGGVICADLLVREAHRSVAGLITVGSQVPFLYEIGAFPALSYPEALPDHLPRWLNVYDLQDILSYVGADLFGDRIRDVQVNNKEPFPRSHSAYWTNPQLWSAVGEFVL